MKLMDGISNVQSARPLKTMAESTESIYLRLPLLCNDANKCATMHQRLHSAGVGAGRMYKKALPDLFANLDERSSDGGMVGFAGARQIADTLLTLPTHHHLTDLDIDPDRIRIHS